MFFMVSGSTLFPSVERSGGKDVRSWYIKRLKRLMPMLIFFYDLSVIFGNLCFESAFDLIKAFIFPTIYWFTGALLLFYFIFFFIEKSKCPYIRVGCAVMLIAGCLFWDNIYSERYFIGFLAMLIGAYIRKRLTDILNRASDDKGQMIGMILLSGMMYVVLKLLRGRGLEVGGVIHLGIGILTIMIAAGILIIGCSYEDKIKNCLEVHRNIRYAIKTLSEVTLAVYLVMGFDDRIIMKQIGALSTFPLSYFIDLSISFLLAYVITAIDKKLQHAMK